ncbi:Cto1 protein [Saccharomycopsis crataegensis]|uniref:Cto1 protein n=1 Tax=Saccharomycopsis crataegensis TaxID=43959 RepID=A0AAV5QFF7_9ASCO|nr:Cto1 protein [Saccharomycopsis crataegensis]
MSIKTAMRLIVVDFDETITKKDTLSQLASLAYRQKPQFPVKFRHYQDVYYKHYSNYVAGHEYLGGKQCPSLKDLFSQELLYQQGMYPVEMSSIDEIVSTGLFKGLESRNLDSLKIPIREGFSLFANECYRQSIPIYVLSITWSARFVKSVLLNNGVAPNATVVISNELEFSEDGTTCTGGFQVGNVRTGYDKLQRLTEILAKNPSLPSLYIGDSRTDLLASLKCDARVFMEKDNNSLLESLSKSTSLEIEPLSDKLQKNENIIYTAKDFVKLNHLLFSGGSDG